MLPENRTRRMRAERELEDRLRRHETFRERVAEWRKLVDGGQAWRDAAERAGVRRSVCRMLLAPEFAARVSVILVEEAAAAGAANISETFAQVTSAVAPWIAEGRPANASPESYPAPQQPPIRDDAMITPFEARWPMTTEHRINPHIEAAGRQEFMFSGPTSAMRAAELARPRTKATSGRRSRRRVS